MPGVTLGFLKYVLGFDSIAFRKGISQSDADLAKLQKSFQRTGAKLAKIGAGMSIALTAPLVAFGKSAFTAASDAAELDSAFQQTFGRLTGTMSKWAEETGNAMGRSTREIKEAANTFGIFFNTAAPPEKAAAMSRQFAKLAEDLGSFFNVDTGDAIEKLRSGLSGEAEPLRAFGVFINEAAVQQKALQLGIVGVNGKLTDQQKIMARAAIILEQTTKAQGDVVRTSAGTANQIRASKAAFEELQITVGTKLLPVFTPLIEKIGAAITWFSQLPQPVQNTVLAIAAVSAVIGPSLTAFGGLLTVVAKVGPAVSVMATAWKAAQAGFLLARTAALATLPAILPYLVPLAAIALAVGAVYLAWKNWDKITAIVKSVYSGVKTWLMDKLNAVWDWVEKKIGAVIGFFKNMWDQVVGHSYVPDMVEAIGVEMRKLDALMVQPALAATSKTAQAFADLQSRVQGLLGRLFPDVASGNQFLQDLQDLRDYAAQAKLPVDALAEAIRGLKDEHFGAVEPGVATDEGANTPLNTGGIDFDAISAAVDNALGKMPQLVDMTREWGSVLGQIGTGALRQITAGLGAAAIGQAKLGDVVQETLARMTAAVVEFTAQVLILESIKAIFGANSGAAGFVSQAFGFGGGRASGGPVMSGKAYLVGEKGPEIFMPSGSGRIVSNDNSRGMLGGMGGGLHVHVTPMPGMSRRESRDTGYQIGVGIQQKLAGSASR